MHRALAGEHICCDLNRLAAAGSIGKPNHYSVIYEPERDGDASIVGVIVVIFDITDRKQAEEHIRLLLREVNHRSKNMLSVVSAIARQTTAPNHEEFVKRFSDRIQALAASHDLLAKSEWRSIAVSELVRTQLAHFTDLMERRILLDGPPLDLSVAGAQCIGMVVHELATNAAKHGALSNEVGRVDVAWQVENGTAGERFTMTWIERGGPAVMTPTHRGFGSTVIKSMVELSLGGDVQLEFARSGLIWRMACSATKVMDATEMNGIG